MKSAKPLPRYGCGHKSSGWTDRKTDGWTTTKQYPFAYGGGLKQYHTYANQPTVSRAVNDVVEAMITPDINQICDPYGATQSMQCFAQHICKARNIPMDDVHMDQLPDHPEDYDGNGDGLHYRNVIATTFF
ncbi:hypothetical protein DPMN_051474 [Dreissena polymorpha]|uniref:Uncharacterized protein n=1 Tax=Dreissena polymorpha TaxID=45954 RepID=A0A9D4CJ21_DREPO|nr:hypothetical protein DPMN_051474 [Dreissena polymorpha]